MIRKAALSDIPKIIEMGRRFYEASGYKDITEFDPESLEQTLRNSGAIILVAEKESVVGMAGALVYPFYFNSKHLTAQEMFWWVDPEHRGIGSLLFDALLEEVKKSGAKSLSMIALENLNPERVGEFYKSRGFRPSDRSYIKRI